MFTKRNIIYSASYLLLSILTLVVLAQTKISPQKPQYAVMHQQEFMKAQVVKVEKEEAKFSKNVTNSFQLLSVKILDGKDKNTIQKIHYDSQRIRENVLKTGDVVVLAKEKDQTNANKYYIIERYRVPQMMFVLIGFLLFVFLIAGWKGFGSIFGLIVSIAVIYVYVLPNILAGHDPLATCLIGAVVIILISTYAAHGFSRQTTVALLATLTSLFLTYFIATFVVSFSLLSGFGSEETYDLHFGQQQIANMRGLLLGGVMIATVGALNDITTTQAAAIFHLAKANTKLNFEEIFSRGFAIGREHVISLVNTLVLAYVGSSLVIFIIMFYNPLNQPYWVMLNSEIISEEVIKTIAGTFGLILAMPIVTFFATIACSQGAKRIIRHIIF